MFASNAKRLILPFFNPKNRESEVEAAAIYVVAELNRSRRGGLFNRQPQETLIFISKVGYPLWVYSKNNSSALVFDGLDLHSHSISFAEAPSATAFLTNLQTYQQPRDAYVAFLCDHSTYFQEPPKTMQFIVRGLIEDTEFRDEFNIYRREATELTEPGPLLVPILEEPIISANLNELDKLLASLTADDAKLTEAQKLMKKTINQYLTEIEFDAAATKEEMDAKIKATQEFVNPEVARFNKEFNRKMKDLSSGFDEGIEGLQKQKNKTDKSIASVQADIREYERNAKAAGKKGHEIYEKRWKEKAKAVEKDLSGLKKELKNLENDIDKLVRQKAVGLSNLNLELENTIKSARQPLVDLEATRDEKIFFYKQESNRLVACEKPLYEGIDSSLKLRQAVSMVFDGLTLTEEQLRSSMLVYVPFYVICYQAGSSRRYLCIPPSVVGAFDFSAKLRGALGASKTQNLFVPRFRAIAVLIAKAEVLIQQNRTFEGQLWNLGLENNLLQNSGFRQNAQSALGWLHRTGWLSEREATELSSQLST
jgi:hypothetical protein